MTLKAQISVQNVKTKLISDFLKLSTYMVKPEMQEMHFSDFIHFKMVVMSRKLSRSCHYFFAIYHILLLEYSAYRVSELLAFLSSHILIFLCYRNWYNNSH